MRPGDGKCELGPEPVNTNGGIGSENTNWGWGPGPGAGKQILLSLKSNVRGLPKKNCFIFFNKSPLRIMKNAYLIVKNLFVIKILKSLS